MIIFIKNRQLLQLTFILLLFGLTNAPVMAEMVEVSGKANIVNGDLDKAREAAINQALNYASLKAGVNFSSEQTINQGNLTQDAFQIQRMGEANNIQLVSEIVTNKDITVLLRLDLQSKSNLQSQQCHSQELKAAIMIPQATINDRSQLRYGQLLTFPKALSEQLGKTLNSQSDYSYARIHADETLDHTNELINFKGNRIPSWLGEITDSQYILQPEIVDISTAPTSSSFLGFVTDDPMRQMSFRLSLYHGISGEKVWSKDYAAEAEWEFERSESVSPTTKRFWQSNYGQTLDQLIQLSTNDIDNLLNCRPLLGQIVAKQGNRIIINLGRRNNVKMGDSFQIVLQQNIPDRVNLMRAVATKNRATVTIEQVSEESATAVLQGIEASGNIQIQDIVIKI
ncbi:flagellar assembly protein FlgT [Shewanella donghaensis]|uniref:flagellar assembly protein FlgT n=1 Tax=Shewanella donghaensis TaxID=238836 RepID=UPI0011835F11|nr:flagellar assembly protein FlgT [Shewanella donghaensis]